MIKINFEEPDTDKWREWRKQCETEQEAHNDKVQSGQVSKVKENVYRGKSYDIKEDVYLNPEGPYHGKCAFCEENIYRNQHGDIEHFRPKDGVSDVNFNPIKIEIDGETQDHPGYYWLCYDWKNLLPSCVLCNQESTMHSRGKLIGKGTRFPVRGHRAFEPGDEVNEEPLLINPVFEDPSDHLQFDSTGVVSIKDDSDKGDTCIKVFGLNDRDLPKGRKDTYDSVVQKLALISQSLTIDHSGAGAKSLIEQLLEHKNCQKEFTVMALLAIGDVKQRNTTFQELLE